MPGVAGVLIVVCDEEKESMRTRFLLAEKRDEGTGNS